MKPEDVARLPENMKADYWRIDDGDDDNDDDDGDDYWWEKDDSKSKINFVTHRGRNRF